MRRRGPMRLPERADPAVGLGGPGEELNAVYPPA